MAKAARKKPKIKKPKFSDQKQSERFVEAARNLGIEKTGSEFEEALAKIASMRTSKK